MKIKKVTLIGSLIFFAQAFSGIELMSKNSQNQKQAYKAYLFVYFEGASGDRSHQEQIRFAVSPDAVNWKALKNNQPVIGSDTISRAGGVRDPHILRGEDGKTFYMVATDMSTAKNGWGPNPGIVLLKSKDLIDWKHAYISMEKEYPEKFAKVQWVWAPQTIYDPVKEKYLVYFTIKFKDDEKLDFYSAYANSDFTAFEDEPELMFSATHGAIDGDIIYKDGLYHLFFKGNTKDANGHEFENGIKQATAKSLQGPWEEHSNYLDVYGNSRTNVEGSSVFKLNNSDEYILMYDLYSSGRYEFQRSTDLYNFTSEPESFTKDFHPRHGSVISITKEEAMRLNEKWGGVPETSSGETKNPILTGYYADPEILYSQKTKKYYIYPTSDGYTNWTGHFFKTFSSENLKDWTDEGTILDLKEVPWAGGRAWAPCIIEKKGKKKGEYAYYFYYTGDGKIGVATAFDPTGPFVDSGKALIDWKPEGINRGAEIDPDVFHDPVSGKNYLYWGNGYCAVVELNKDMVSIREKTLKIITPPHFREAMEVFYRNGLYYFLWSENDTRSEDYRVRYGTSKSPMGPIDIPEDNLILSKNSGKGIYGTGHNSVLQLPGEDEWHIIYHRFNRPDGITMGRAAGYHREVCMDKMEFNEDGSIKPVVVTE